MFIKENCICKKNSKSKFKLLIKYENETVFAEYEGISIYKCINCGVLKTISDKNPKIKQKSRSWYYEKNKKKFIEIFKPIIEIIKKYKKNGQVLDVGCSSGILLELLEKRGFDAYGLEPNKQAYAIAKSKFKNKIFNCKLNEFIASNGLKFDIVIYNHGLEHIQDPIFELELIKKVLKNNGIFVLGLPNTSNIIFILRNKYWESLMPNEHIWHFSKKQVIQLLNKKEYLVKSITFSNDKRQDYTLIKRAYFNFLSQINKLFNTGESMLILSKKG